ncbi:MULTISPECIES: hypothetical protein [unclassified Arcicella]|uniref:hypothetical protein n=1 Tax=unclassified Arcicella TaxID=2644986 RepID=UPI002860E74E|nr:MULTISPECIES: hypothetical protein [unclassified Arcicella]MDR6560543.1 hypothetical protein [Arcicella sp. BE51]MDR6809851.1 hypothetical protein [Arcicella sp. BE140]MDR6821200.1 hypothetical protein [Arcicella sp. BE139]
MSAEKIFKKLRLDSDKALLIVNAPSEYGSLLEGVNYDTEPRAEGIYDFVQVFAIQQAELETLMKSVGKAGKFDCVFWACYPKGTGKIKSDIKRETVWTAFDLIELQAVSQVAIDETWSALRGRPATMVGK